MTSLTLLLSLPSIIPTIDSDLKRKPHPVPSSINSTYLLDILVFPLPIPF